MKSTIKLFGKRIKEIRKRQNITQEKLAELLDLDNQTISRIETGCYFTSYDNLEKLARVLNVDIKEFFNFSHLKDRNELLNDLTKKLYSLSEKDLQKVSKFVREFV